MATFFGSMLIYGGLILGLTLPVAILAPQKGQFSMVRHFLVAGAIITVLVASLETTSAQLVAKCEAVGNTACWDYGGLGMLLLFIVPYGVVALIKAYLLYRE